MAEPMKPKYRSRFEKEVGAALTKLGIVWDFESESLQYTIEHNYIPDFIIQKLNGDKMYVETKGYFSPKDRTKTLAVLKQHPGIDLRFLFCNADNSLTAGSKTTYAMWCDKHGIKWAEERLPDKWIYECERG